MLDAFAERIRRWDPQPRPKWITYIPGLDPANGSCARSRSRSRSTAVTTRPRRGREAASQPTAEAHAELQQQAANVRGAFRDRLDTDLSRSLLLVDDIVDSRWTMARGRRVTLSRRIWVGVPRGSRRILLMTVITQRDVALVALTTRAVATRCATHERTGGARFPGLAEPEALLGLAPEALTSHLRIDLSTPHGCTPFSTGLLNRPASSNKSETRDVGAAPRALPRLSGRTAHTTGKPGARSSSTAWATHGSSPKQESGWSVPGISPRRLSPSREISDSGRRATGRP